MNIGTVCYATSRGLGHLARDFYRNGVVSRVLVVRHSKIPMNDDWYPGATVLDCADHRNYHKAQEFCRGLDGVVFWETPFYWDLLPWCRSEGVRTYLLTMYECMPRQYHNSPRHQPTRYLCPSLLDMDYFPQGTLVQLPVDYPWKLRTRAEHYVHNGGYLGVKGREGTCKLIDAMEHVKSPLKLTIRVQENVPKSYQVKMARDPRIEYVPETIPYQDLYGTGDVAVGAQRWNGCSLPLQEALASGMLVMNTNRYPMNTWLPRDPLIPVDRYVKDSVSGAYLDVDAAEVDPVTMARVMDDWYGRDITEYSLCGKEWAEANSWERLKPRWLEVLSS